MKIEKINDNQIRCTLTKDDLATRQIKLSELAYGTEKAKNLFRDMMLQAQDQFGFEADNIPLMIEAIPITADSIVLIITKVDDPEELDTRFSKFSPSTDEETSASPQANDITGADDILDIFQKLYEGKRKKKTGSDKPSAGSVQDPSVSQNSDSGPEDSESAEQPDLMRLFTFSDLDIVLQASRSLNGCYNGENSLYKNQSGQYLLILHQSGSAPEDFNKICNILSEYGKGRACSPAGEAFLLEHAEILSARQALQQLATVVC